MSRLDWSDVENDLIVADYFAMLADDISGRPYNKAEHRRHLAPLLADRSDGSIEFKHQNISAVLKGLGEDWIPGYKPAFNFQTSLEDAVQRWISAHPAWLDRLPGSRDAQDRRETPTLWIGPAPTHSNLPPPEELGEMLRIASKFDVASRDARNRTLGRAGEEIILGHERSVLKAAGRYDLADKVRWISEGDGDGAGYDIASFTPEGQPRLIEVKTTNGGTARPSIFRATSSQSRNRNGSIGACCASGTFRERQKPLNCGPRWKTMCPFQLCPIRPHLSSYGKGPGVG
jgi:hypothetical protein